MADYSLFTLNHGLDIWQDNVGLFYKNPSNIRLWEFIIAHVMKNIKPIFQPTALRRRRFNSLTTL